MDLLVEALIQFIVEFIAEVALERAYHGAARALRSTYGRTALMALLGLAFGLAWGAHLGDRATPPQLLWVSLALAAATAVLLVYRLFSKSQPTTEPPPQSSLRQTLVLPWKWPVPRLISFVILNLAIAAGVATGYTSM